MQPNESEIEARKNAPGLRGFYHRYEQWWPTVFFLLGAGYDILTLDPIDSPIALARQAAFLLVSALLLAGSVFVASERWHPQGWKAKFWEYHEVVIHFLLGGLLSEYTLFFLKSASLYASAVFLCLLGVLIFINEFRQISGHSGIPLRTALLGICLVSYSVSLVPLLLGFVGVLPFLLSLLLSSGLFYYYIRFLRKFLPHGELPEKAPLGWGYSDLKRRYNTADLIQRRITWPLMAVIAGFLILYFTRLIPPIPISMTFAGIYHQVEKASGQYQLKFDPRGTSYLQNGEKTFYAQAGDRPYFFVQIFSPKRFSDQVQVRWLFKDAKRGWVTADVIPMSIAGGRREGYRGYSYKSNYQPGAWQVRVETTDSREVGRLYFDIVADDGATPRTLATDLH